MNNADGAVVVGGCVSSICRPARCTWSFSSNASCCIFPFCRSGSTKKESHRVMQELVEGKDVEGMLGALPFTCQH